MRHWLKLTSTLLFITHSVQGDPRHRDVFNWKILGTPTTIAINHKRCIQPKGGSSSLVCVSRINIVSPGTRALMREFSQDPEKALSKRGIWGVNVSAGVVFEDTVQKPELLVASFDRELRLFVRIPAKYEVAQFDTWAKNEGKLIWGGLTEKVIGEMGALVGGESPLTVRYCDGTVLRRPGALTLGQWLAPADSRANTPQSPVLRQTAPSGPMEISSASESPEPSPTSFTEDQLLASLNEANRVLEDAAKAMIEVRKMMEEMDNMTETVLDIHSFMKPEPSKKLEGLRESRNDLRRERARLERDLHEEMEFSDPVLEKEVQDSTQAEIRSLNDEIDRLDREYKAELKRTFR